LAGVWLSLGNLNNGVGNAGLSIVNANNGLGNARWNILARISVFQWSALTWAHPHSREIGFRMG
jgi:hypothetical protein